MPAQIKVKKVPGKNRGAFAARSFAKGDFIEQAPVIVIPAEEWKQMESTVLYNYVYAWGDDGEEAALPLGYGSIYNHSYTPNARYERKEEQQSVFFYAIKDIAEGEEVTINYNGIPECKDPVWFSVHP